MRQIHATTSSVVADFLHVEGQAEREVVEGLAIELHALEAIRGAQSLVEPLEQFCTAAAVEHAVALVACGDEGFY